MNSNIISVGASAVLKDSDALREKHTFMSNFGDPVLNYRVDGEYIHLPRSLGNGYGEETRDEGRDIEVLSQFKPRNEDQTRAVT